MRPRERRSKRKALEHAREAHVQGCRPVFASGAGTPDRRGYLRCSIGTYGRSVGPV